MKMNKDSFLFKVAYEWSPTNHSCSVKDTSLCKFFWRFLFGLLIGWPIVWPILWIALLVLFGLTYCVGFFFYKRPDLSGNSTDGEFVSYKHSPHIGKFKIYPIYFIIALVLFKLSRLVYQFFGSNLTLIMLAVVLLAIIIALGVAFIIKSDSTKLLRDYIKAKKEKVCPLIKFED